MAEPLSNSEPVAFHETVETPEQVQLHLELAGLGTRSIAFLIDALVRYGSLFVVVVAVMLIFSLRAIPFDELGARFGIRAIIIGLTLLYFAMEWTYFALFEWLWNGQTPGKRAMHIRVLKDGGGPISFLDAAVRNLLRPIDSSFALCPIGILFIFFNRKHKRPGDLVARTIVVRERPRTVAQLLGATAAPPPPPGPFAELISRIVLSTDEHEMLNRYCQRRAQLDPGTRSRLAQQIATVLVEKARAQSPRLDLPVPLPGDSERFLEDLLAVQHQRGGPSA